MVGSRSKVSPGQLPTISQPMIPGDTYLTFRNQPVIIGLSLPTLPQYPLGTLWVDNNVERKRTSFLPCPCPIPVPSNTY